jgi:hypothetical protein
MEDGAGVLVGSGGVLLAIAAGVGLLLGRAGMSVAVDGAVATTVLDGDACGAADVLAPSPRITTTIPATATASTPPANASHQRRSRMKLTSCD